MSDWAGKGETLHVGRKMDNVAWLVAWLSLPFHQTHVHYFGWKPLNGIFNFISFNHAIITPSFLPSPKKDTDTTLSTKPRHAWHSFWAIHSHMHICKLAKRWISSLHWFLGEKWKSQQKPRKPPRKPCYPRTTTESTKLFGSSSSWGGANNNSAPISHQLVEKEKVTAGGEEEGIG